MHDMNKILSHLQEIYSALLNVEVNTHDLCPYRLAYKEGVRRVIEDIKVLKAQQERQEEEAFKANLRIQRL